jgi:hypothetical protein
MANLKATVRFFIVHFLLVEWESPILPPMNGGKLGISGELAHVNQTTRALCAELVDDKSLSEPTTVNNVK